MVTQDMLAQLEPGMDRAKVRFIMGTPLVMDAFHQDRWDYVYSYQKGGGGREQRRVTLHFEDDRLVSIGGNVKPAQGELAREGRREITVAVPGEVKPGLISWLKTSIGLGEKQEIADEDSAGKQEKKEATEGKYAQATVATPDSSESAAEGEESAQEEQSFFSQAMRELEGGNKKKTGLGQQRGGPEIVDSMGELAPLNSME